MRVVLWLERCWQDLRYGFRVFAKAPGFTAIAILSIACGTGANVAMFSVADALLLRPLPVPRPDELMVVGSRVNQGRWTNTSASYPDYVDIRNASRSFDGMLADRFRRLGVTSEPGAAPQVKLVDLVKMILRQGMRPAWFGLPAGVVLSIVSTRLLPMIFPTGDRYDPRTFVVAVPILLAVTLLAAFVPARRAARVDPTVALRHEV